MTGSDADEMAALRRILHRSAVTEVLHRYRVAVDTHDNAALRGVFADGVRARYGNGDWIEGVDALAEWLVGATRGIVWQHHNIFVYQIDIDGDQAAVVSHMTSHQMYENAEDSVQMVLTKYRDRLVHINGGWKIIEKVEQYLWAEKRRDALGHLDALGGRGPFPLW